MILLLPPVLLSVILAPRARFPPLPLLHQGLLSLGRRRSSPFVAVPLRMAGWSTTVFCAVAGHNDTGAKTVNAAACIGFHACIRSGPTLYRAFYDPARSPSDAPLRLIDARPDRPEVSGLRYFIEPSALVSLHELMATIMRGSREFCAVPWRASRGRRALGTGVAVTREERTDGFRDTFAEPLGVSR